MEERKYEAVARERFESARKLKEAVKELEVVGQVLGALEMEKQKCKEAQDYARAKDIKNRQDEERERCYRDLEISTLLDMQSPAHSPSRGRRGSFDLPPPNRHKTKPRSRSSSKERNDSPPAPPPQSRQVLPPARSPKAPPPRQPSPPATHKREKSEGGGNKGYHLTMHDKSELKVKEAKKLEEELKFKEFFNERYNPK